MLPSAANLGLFLSARSISPPPIASSRAPVHSGRNERVGSPWAVVVAGAVRLGYCPFPPYHALSVARGPCIIARETCKVLNPRHESGRGAMTRQHVAEGYGIRRTHPR